MFRGLRGEGVGGKGFVSMRVSGSQVVKGCLAHLPLSFNPVGSRGLGSLIKWVNNKIRFMIFRKRQLCGAHSPG